jgi:hypothetical protein
VDQYRRGKGRKENTHDSESSRTSSVNDDLDSLDRLIKRSLLGNSLLQDDSLDLAGVLAAVLLEPEIGLLLPAKGEADGIAEVEEAKGDGGSDETGGPGDDDGSGGVEGGGGHG